MVLSHYVILSLLLFICYCKYMQALYGNNPTGVSETWFDGTEVPRTASTYETYISRFPNLISIINSGLMVLDLGAGDAQFADQINNVSDSKSKVVRCDIGYKDAEPHSSELAVAGSALKLPFADQSFDVVLSSLLLQHLHPAQQAVAGNEIGRVLKSNGLALLYRHKNNQDPEYLNKTVGLDASSLKITGLLASIRAF